MFGLSSAFLGSITRIAPSPRVTTIEADVSPLMHVAANLGAVP